MEKKKPLSFGKQKSLFEGNQKPTLRPPEEVKGEWINGSWCAQVTDENFFKVLKELKEFYTEERLSKYKTAHIKHGEYTENLRFWAEAEFERIRANGNHWTILPSLHRLFLVMCYIRNLESGYPCGRIGL